MLLGEMTPDRDRMAQVYRYLRDEQRKVGEGFFMVSDAQIAQGASTPRSVLSPAAVACAISVFRELGLVETHTTFSSDAALRAVRVVPTQDKVELENSVRYREGLNDQAIFAQFSTWALDQPVEVLQERIARPILPACVPVL